MFLQFKIDSTERSLERIHCPKCNGSYSSYCPKCCISLQDAPLLTLPVPLCIYRHPLEVVGKSTSAHAKAICPDSVQIIVDTLLQDGDYSRTLLLFPSKDAIPFSQIDRSSFDRILVIDGTWRQAKAMSLNLTGLRKVSIAPRETLFWRFQKLDKTYLATIEAIYWLFVEYHNSYESTVYDGRYDNLLFYFKLNYEIIQRHYKNNPHKQFTKKHANSDSYIQYD